MFIILFLEMMTLIEWISLLSISIFLTYLGWYPALSHLFAQSDLRAESSAFLAFLDLRPMLRLW